MNKNWWLNVSSISCALKNKKTKPSQILSHQEWIILLCEKFRITGLNHYHGHWTLAWLKTLKTLFCWRRLEIHMVRELAYK